jgi:glycosyltransferase involved in cell wall biosynthesis
LGVAGKPALPVSVATRSKGGFRRAIAAALKGVSYDVVIFDHMAMWQYADDLTSGALRVGIAHDVLSQLWDRRAASRRGIDAIGAGVEARRLRKWERNALGKLDLACALCAKDSQMLAESAGDVPRYVLQPWFSRNSDAGLGSAAREHNSMVFTGAYDRRENGDAVKFAVNEILPRITAAVPQCSFHIAGGFIGRLARLAACDPHVRLAFFVPDLPAFLSRMQIALLPLRLGAGIKIKVLEAMAAGLAVVTTPVGAEGIGAQDGVHLLLGVTAEELARHATFLLENPSLCAQVGARAREFIRNNYDFERSARDFEWTLIQRLSQRQFRARRTGDLASRDEPDSCVPCRRQVPGD